MDQNAKRPVKSAALNLFLIALLFACLYVGAYLTLVQVPSRAASADFNDVEDINGLDFERFDQWPDAARIVWKPKYRFGGAISRWVFWPLYRIDLRLRETQWQHDGSIRKVLN